MNTNGPASLSKATTKASTTTTGSKSPTTKKQGGSGVIGQGAVL